MEKFGDWGRARAITGTMVQKFAIAQERATLQEAEFMRGELVKYIDAQEGFAALNPKTIAVRAFTKFSGTKALIRRGDLRNSISVKKVGEGAFVGVLRSAQKNGRSLANIADLMENGGQIVVPITLKSRRFYHAAMAAAGLSLGGSGGSHRGHGGPVIAIVKIPARPVFGPVFEKHGKPDLVRARFAARLAHIFAG